MAPVEIMAVAKTLQIACALSRPEIEQTIQDVDGPGAEEEQQGDPSRELDAG